MDELSLLPCGGKTCFVVPWTTRLCALDGFSTKFIKDLRGKHISLEFDPGQFLIEDVQLSGKLFVNDRSVKFHATAPLEVEFGPGAEKAEFEIYTSGSFTTETGTDFNLGFVLARPLHQTSPVITLSDFEDTSWNQDWNEINLRTKQDLPELPEVRMLRFQACGVLSGLPGAFEFEFEDGTLNIDTKTLGTYLGKPHQYGRAHVAHGQVAGLSLRADQMRKLFYSATFYSDVMLTPTFTLEFQPQNDVCGIRLAQELEAPYELHRYAAYLLDCEFNSLRKLKLKSVKKPRYLIPEFGDYKLGPKIPSSARLEER